MEQAKATGHYKIECRSADGEILWTDEIKNLVTTPGKNYVLDSVFQAGSVTFAWYLGLISSTGYTTGPAAGDTMASHAGWAEDTNYSQTTRIAPIWNAAGSGSKATQTVSFSISDDVTIKGVFLVSNSAKGGVLGLLYSVGLFSGGDRAMSAGQLLNMVWTGGL
jgi:hypothetical protein